jgi:hypothetical protein
VPDALDALSAAGCLAVGLLVDAGEHGRANIPALLAPVSAPLMPGRLAPIRRSAG